MVDIDILTMVKFTHRNNHHIAPKPHQHRATPSTQARSWHQGSAAEVADAMGATASTGSGPVFNKRVDGKGSHGNALYKALPP